MEGFDAAAVFDRDFSYFYADRIGETRTDSDFSLLSGIVGEFGGLRVLDLCCGEGRLARRLADAGAAVVGLDRSLDYLDHAAADGSRDRTPVRYLAGDARALPFVRAFDLIVCWYTSFGYFDDVTNREVLSEMRRALLPGGMVIVDLDAKAHLLRSSLPTQVRERGDDVMVEQFRYDAPHSRVRAIRTIAREGALRRSEYFVRIFDPDELERWMDDLGFEQIELFGEDGARYADGARRMVACARRSVLAR